MARLTNSAYPHVRSDWDDIYTGTRRGSRLAADHIAGLTWDDLRAPATGINPPGAVSDPDIDTTTGHLLFADNSTETVAIFFQFPHNYAEGTDITPHVHWIKQGANPVVWQLEYIWYNIAGEYTGSYTTITTSGASPDYGDVSPAVEVHTISFFERIAGTGKTISSMFECKLSRLGGDAGDTYSGDARFVEFDLHYLKLGHGSEGAGARVADFSDIAGA